MLCSVAVTTSTLDAEPACPGAGETPDPEPASRALRAERRAFDDIPRDVWDRLVARNPWATPFSAWAFHRAWWDAYGQNAHEQTLVVIDPEAAPDADPVAIVPLMHRHEVETTDAITRTTIRQGAHLELTPVEPTAKAVFFGASYHSDYATILAAPDDLPAVAQALVTELAAPSPTPSTRPTGTSSTCGASAAATPRPRRLPRRSVPARSPRTGPSTSSARTSAPS